MQRFYVWKVTCDEEFSSSSGMMKYAVQHLGRTRLVLTETDSFDDAGRSLAKAMNGQTRVTQVHSVELLGEAMSCT